MELVEERAPNGFTKIEEIISRSELETISARYKVTAGFDPDILNNRPTLSVRPVDDAKVISDGELADI